MTLTFDPNTGLPLGSLDDNSVQTSYPKYDNLGRPTSVTQAEGDKDASEVRREDVAKIDKFRDNLVWRFPWSLMCVIVEERPDDRPSSDE